MQINAQLTATDRASSVFKSAAVKQTRSMKDVTIGMAGVATAAQSLYLGYDNLAKVELAARRQEVTLTSAVLAHSSAQSGLNRLVDKGVVSGEMYEIAQERLAMTQQMVINNTDDLAIKQDAIGQAYVNFALTIIPSSITMIAGMGMALKGLGVTTAGVIGPIKGVGMAMKGLVVSMGPIGYAMIALVAIVGILALAWNQNWGDIQGKTRMVGDAIVATFKWISETGTAVWTTFLDALTFIWDNTFGKLYTDITTNLEMIKGAFDWLSNVLVGNSVYTNMMNAILANTKTGLGNTMGEFDAFRLDAVGGMETMTTDMLLVYDEGLNRLAKKIDDKAPSLLKSWSKIAQAELEMAQEVWEIAIPEVVKNGLSTMGEHVDDYMDRIAKSNRDVISGTGKSSKTSRRTSGSALTAVGSEGFTTAGGSSLGPVQGWGGGTGFVRAFQGLREPIQFQRAETVNVHPGEKLFPAGGGTTVELVIPAAAFESIARGIDFRQRISLEGLTR